jgi:hypothetical protein
MPSIESEDRRDRHSAVARLRYISAANARRHCFSEHRTSPLPGSHPIHPYGPRRPRFAPALAVFLGRTSTLNRVRGQPLRVLEESAKGLRNLPMLVTLKSGGKRPGIQQNVSSQLNELGLFVEWRVGRLIRVPRERTRRHATHLCQSPDEPGDRSNLQRQIPDAAVKIARPPVFVLKLVSPNFRRSSGFAANLRRVTALSRIGLRPGAPDDFYLKLIRKRDRSALFTVAWIRTIWRHLKSFSRSGSTLGNSHLSSQLRYHFQSRRKTDLASAN